MTGTKKESYLDPLLDMEDENETLLKFVSEVRKVLPIIIGKLSGIDEVFDTIVDLEKLLEQTDSL